MSSIPERRHHAATTLSDVGKLPVLLTLTEVAALYGLSPRTIRNQLQTQSFRPLPFDTFPYRWLREDVIRDLQTREQQRK